MIKQDDVYKIGRIGKPHGIKGELTMMVEDDVFDRVEGEYLILLIDGILVPFFIEDYRFRSEQSALVKFCDIDTQERASELTGCDVFFPRSLSDSDDTDTLTWQEAIGYQVADDNSGKTLGTISYIDTSTANTLIELDNGMLIPAAYEIIKDINTEQRLITMSLPEGLMEIWQQDNTNDDQRDDMDDNDNPKE
ncbi:MAG: ribosome maturation factor RimM [Prevotellaceae bacterium]|nr:ribosome maturation factor RimM [Prevotella sp.]MDD6817879.1 ribosome maturation factor RimM [Prevotellaceae bacterium]MDY5004889.1 ribosome maturation factor RimM [Prevotella sp.]